MAEGSSTESQFSNSSIKSYVRLGLVAQKELPNLLREILLKKEPPDLLEDHLRKNNFLSRIFNEREMNIIKNACTNQYSDFDIPLMYKIIRHLKLVRAPTGEWHNKIIPTWRDISVGDDVNRIRWIWNDIIYMYRENVNLTDAELQIYFSFLHDIAGRLEDFLEKPKQFVKIFKNIQACQIDQEIQQRCLSWLKDLAESENALNSGDVHRDCTALKVVQDFQRKVFTLPYSREEIIPEKRRDDIKMKIEKWRSMDEKFVATRAADNAMKCIEENGCVTITGNAGVGKSFIAQHIALALEKGGHQIIPVLKPSDIIDFYHPHKFQLFVVDDICGKFTANQQQIENWRQLIPVIETIMAGKWCKIIATCRLNVFKDDKFNILSPFKTCECNLTTEDLFLTSVEKARIAEVHIGTCIKDLDEISKHHEYFPLLCSLYQEKEGLDVKESFFSNPFEVYRNEIDNMSRQGDEEKFKVCGLALCVLFNNQLKETWFHSCKVTDQQRQILEDTCVGCRLNKETSKVDLKDALEKLEGTFVCKQNGVYSIIHEVLFDCLAHYFGQRMIECLIEHGDCDFINKRFLWKNLPDDQGSNVELLIQIPDDKLDLFLERLVQDWSAGKVLNLFSNNNMKEQAFRYQLLQYLERLDKSQQIKLSNTKNTVTPEDICDLEAYPLIWASYFGYSNMVKWLLENKVNVDHCRHDGVTALYMACQNGHNAIVQLLLDKNANVNLYNEGGMTPLYIASKNGHLDIVRMLLEENVDVNLYDRDGRTPLYVACDDGNTAVVSAVLEKNPDVNLSDSEGETPLNIACYKGLTDVVFALLEKNPDVNLCNILGDTPLSTASGEGHNDIAGALLDKNPDVNLCDDTGGSALFLACQKGHTDSVAKLLQKNPEINRFDEFYNDTPLTTACEKGYTGIVALLLQEEAIDVNLCDKQDKLKTPLSLACCNGHTDIVRLLLEKNSDVNLCDRSGNSPLYLACSKDYIDIVRMLLESNPDIDLCNEDGETPLMIAIQNGCTDIACMLLEKDADVNLYDSSETSTLYWACLEGYREIVSKLLENGADVNHPNDDGSTPLIAACQGNYNDIILMLIEHKADINKQMYDGDNPLISATHNGYPDVVEVLLTHGADINRSLHNKHVLTGAIHNLPNRILPSVKREWYEDVMMSFGSSVTKEYFTEKSVDYVFDIFAGSHPLHIASFMGHTDIARLLLDHKANVNVKKKDGTTSLFYACEVGHEDIVELLLEKGADQKICRKDKTSPVDIATRNGHDSILMMLKGKQ
ncbi:uncharacterized protein LOC127711032 [Mytilus californianus]|uniref:uncharacterized protein LOC127711032 n=1 Tax=Mytilus californianus TaxID=6549 RepID=UPI0022455674|nr:uncharacterized protein LOC127711032 [Mytilus californianus]